MAEWWADLSDATHSFLLDLDPAHPQIFEAVGSTTLPPIAPFALAPGASQSMSLIAPQVEGTFTLRLKGSDDPPSTKVRVASSCDDVSVLPPTG